MLKFKSLVKISALMMFFISGVSNSQLEESSGCPEGSDPYGQICGYVVSAICPPGGWVYAGNGICQWTQRAECPAGSQMLFSHGTGGQCWHVVAPRASSPAPNNSVYKREELMY